MKPLLTLLLLLISAQAECPIECYCDRVTTCTGDKLLSRFPTNVLSASTSSFSSSGYLSSSGIPVRLELHDYAVLHLSRRDFLEILGNLTEISISRNTLETFDNDTFSLDTHSPSSVSRAPVRATTISETQRTLRNSEFLPLRILDLSQNKLSYFVGGRNLAKLRILDLSSNQLQQVYLLSEMESLESINLRDNRLSYLAANTFQNLRNLQYVNLDSNALRSLDPSTFSNLPALAHLILSSNPISNLLPGFFWNSRVQFVDVSKVGLTSIPTSLTKTIRDFRAASNNLSVIKQTDFESYPNVGLLVLDENQIETIEDDAFGRLDFLARLWINGNRLQRIPQNLPPTLRSLQLEDNRIGNLSGSDFKGLHKLEELNLHSNRIPSLPPFIFASLTSLKSLDLRSNLIDVIYRDSFANLTKLETLDISQNPLKVIVTGAFSNVRRISLLHMSRLMEPIEFDVAAFRPLQSVQIFELDDSPHLSNKMFQDGAFSNFPYLLELNIQRCELEDVNIVSNALVELGDLATVKMAENNWDCQDLRGSAIHELISRRIIVDEPECLHPVSLKGKRLTSFQNAEGEESGDDNFDHSDHNHQLFTTSVHHSAQNKFLSSSSPPGTTSEENINFSREDIKVVTRVPSSSPSSWNTSGQVSHNSSPSPVIVMTKPRLSFSFQNSFPHLKNPPSATPPDTGGSRVATAGTTTTTNSSQTPAKASGSPSGSPERASKSSSSPPDVSVNPLFGDLSDGDGDLAVPTQSYFDYTNNNNNNRGDDAGDGDASASATNIRGGGPRSTNSSPPPTNLLPISSTKNNNNNNKPPSTTKGRQGGPSWKTKTNDDNTIIDDESGGGKDRSGPGAAEVERQATQQLDDDARSIDGFPLAYPAHSSASDGKADPKYSYLKLQTSASKLQRRSDLPDDHVTTSHMSMIIKTLVISALTCLITILSLFLVSLAVYRRWCSRASVRSFQIRRSRSRSVIFPCAGRCSRDEGEDTPTHDQGAGMIYTRFGRRKSRRRESNSGASLCPHLQHNPESDSDQVELSGITNSLYFENEDIYHIT